MDPSAGRNPDHHCSLKMFIRNKIFFGLDNASVIGISQYWMSYKLPLCLRVSLAVMKHHGQNQVVEERVNWTYTFTLGSIPEGSQDRNPNMEET